MISLNGLNTLRMICELKLIQLIRGALNRSSLNKVDRFQGDGKSRSESLELIELILIFCINSTNGRNGPNSIFHVRV